MKSNLGRRSKQKMKNGSLSEKGRKKKKSLLLHYDKHENNFPPIFSIKIIAFFAFYSAYFSLSSSEKRAKALLLLLLLVACLKLKSVFLCARDSWAEMEMKHSERKYPRNIRFLIEFLILADASNGTSRTDPSNFLHKLLPKNIEQAGGNFIDIVVFTTASPSLFCLSVNSSLACRKNISLSFPLRCLL